VARLHSIDELNSNLSDQRDVPRMDFDVVPFSGSWHDRRKFSMNLARIRRNSGQKTDLGTQGPFFTWGCTLFLIADPTIG
jgi:hypothetical protein